MKPFTAAILLASALSSFAGKPNILFICVDDLKPVLGCYGDKIAKTPNIDRLASRSTLFERAYCNQAICAPSRISLLTGLRPDTLGIYDLFTNFRLVRPDAETLPQVFMKAGYRTEALGKILHPGQEDSASWSVKHWFPTSPKYALAESTAAMRDGKNGARGAATECADVADNFYDDGKIAEEAIARIKTAASKPKEPFFLGVGFLKPHLPFVAPKKYWDLYERAKMPLALFRDAPKDAPSYARSLSGELHQYSDVIPKQVFPDDYQRLLIHGYYAATSYIDAQIGKVLDELDASGLAENTIIVLWGDHGWHLGDHGMWCKHTNYEEAARIPFMIAKAGAKNGSGTHTDAFMETVDIFPTLCGMAKIKPADGLDGINNAAVMEDPTTVTKDHIIHVYPRGNRIGRAIRTDFYRMVEWKVPGASAETADIELYDYVKDPLEKENVAKANPEIVKGMREILAKYPEAKPQFVKKAKATKSSPKAKP